VQNRGNVWVVQNPLPCLPCEKLGCEGHLNSFSRCMDELPAAQVLAVVDRALQRVHTRAQPAKQQSVLNNRGG
jgi:heptosyltransferase-3